MKQFKRSAVAVLSAALLGAAGLAATATPANAAQDTAGSASTAQTVTLRFDYTSWSHWTKDASDASHAGTLNAGWNYVYCYSMGGTVTDVGRTSATWFLTDDDSGNKNVWVSKVFLARDQVNIDVPKCQ
ncbi:protein serine/threonine kinase [Streptomyces laurentii]|uniref:Protein serine/threonine kinase n=1 Tax=Streptomyces laurentii TaxID=39478 RepID=A0A160PAM8_STRLU|nr:protein serine/threonine kinase [Streptomyces laurentii]